jgi:hypothetical protein
MIIINSGMGTMEEKKNEKKYDLLFIIGARLDQVGLTTNGQLELVIVFCRGSDCLLKMSIPGIADDN